MPVLVDPNNLVRRTFLMPEQEDGKRFQHARIVQAIEDHERDLANDLDRIQFLCSVNDDQFEVVLL
jgi:hypothetical protein